LASDPQRTPKYDTNLLSSRKPNGGEGDHSGIGRHQSSIVAIQKHAFRASLQASLGMPRMANDTGGNYKTSVNYNEGACRMIAHSRKTGEENGEVFVININGVYSDIFYYFSTSSLCRQ
jgi:hypothetical protein